MKISKTMGLPWAAVCLMPHLALAQSTPAPVPPDAPEPVVAWAVTQAPAEPEAPAPPARTAPRAPGKPAPPAAPKAPAAPATPGTPVAPPAPEAPSQRPLPMGERVNVLVELRLKVLSGREPVSEKPITVMTLGDGSKTGLRSSADVQLRGGGQTMTRNIGLNADVRATVDAKRIFLGLTLSYTILAPATSAEQMPQIVNMNSDSRTLLEDGKQLVVSQQVDAATDYRLIVEAKATIQR